MARFGAALAAFALLAGVASAKDKPDKPDKDKPPAAPEIDAGSITGGLALLSGGMLLLNGRRAKPRVVSED